MKKTAKAQPKKAQAKKAHARASRKSADKKANQDIVEKAKQATKAKERARGAAQRPLRDRRDPAARPRAKQNVCLGDPQRAARAAGDRDGREITARRAHQQSGGCLVATNQQYDAIDRI